MRPYNTSLNDWIDPSSNDEGHRAQAAEDVRLSRLDETAMLSLLATIERIKGRFKNIEQAGRVPGRKVERCNELLEQLLKDLPHV